MTEHFALKRHDALNDACASSIHKFAEVDIVANIASLQAKHFLLLFDGLIAEPRLVVLSALNDGGEGHVFFQNEWDGN